MEGNLLKRDRLVYQGSGGSAALQELLLAESLLYGELVELSHREQEALLERNILTLVHVIRRKEDLVQRVGGLENERAQAVAEWSRMLGVKSSSPTLGELLPFLGKGEAQALDGLRETILGQIEELATINKRNALLLTSALALVDASLNFILGGGSPKGATYAEDGQLRSATEGRGVRGVLDLKV